MDEILSDSSFERLQTANDVKALIAELGEGDDVEQLRKIVEDRIEVLFDEDEGKSNVQRKALNKLADKLRIKRIIHRIGG